MSKQTIDDALDFVGQEARHWVMDSLYCMFRNEGQYLDGNTEVNDTQWFARRLYEMDTNWSWDVAETTTQERYIKIAAFCIENLPLLIDRIANRYIAMSKALETTMRIEREREHQISQRLIDQTKQPNDT